MKIILIILLLLALFGGLYLAVNILTNKTPPLSAANIHGSIALLVLATLGYHAFSLNETRLWIALGILVITAAGGIYLYGNHKKGQPGPKSAVIIHGVFGLSGILLILISIL